MRESTTSTSLIGTNYVLLLLYSASKHFLTGGEEEKTETYKAHEPFQLRMISKETKTGCPAIFEKELKVLNKFFQGHTLRFPNF